MHHLPAHCPGLQAPMVVVVLLVLCGGWIQSVIATAVPQYRSTAVPQMSRSRLLSSIGGNVNILFEELDASGSESDLIVNAPVRIEGDNRESFTLIATPLTEAQYQADPSAYGNICDSIITDNSVDPAEG